MKTLLKICVAGLFLMSGIIVIADDYKVDEEHWYAGTTAGWSEANPTGGWVSAWSLAHNLEGGFEALEVPHPETDSFRADASASSGNLVGALRAGGAEPYAISFLFKPLDQLPSSLLLRLTGGMTNTFFSSLTDFVFASNQWHRLAVSLEYDSNVWMGGDVTAFSNLLNDVQSIEIQVTRAGETVQAYAVDDFALTMRIPEPMASLDSDGDGIPDFWEDQFFGGPTNAVADVDSDHDGFSNLEEYLAQTVPTEALSYLRIYDVAGTQEGEIFFEGELGREYAVERKADLLVPGWTLLTNRVAGTGGLSSVTFTPSAGDRFYRIRVSRP